MNSAGTTPLLDIRGLTVRFATRGGAFTAVDGVDLRVDADEVLAIVGESGSGKSVAMLAIMGLLPWTATVSAERLAFAGQDLRALSARQRRGLIGRDIAMVFQEPMSSLNPCFTVGWQIGESLSVHLGLDRKARRRRVIELLERVGIPDPARRAGAFPHQLSGGMSQRVMIAMALACQPRLLIADEPTTALDVTIQAQILDLLLSLRRGTAGGFAATPSGTAQRPGGMALVLITHDLGVVAETADRVVVQYAGRQVESAQVDALFADPHHPYTAALLAALPEQAHGKRLAAIPGLVPGQFDRPPGCLFAPRCAFATPLCQTAPPAASAALGLALCHTPLRHGQAIAAAQPDTPLGTTPATLSPANR
jgi:dipeptide transport system ATP-binding protein